MDKTSTFDGFPLLQETAIWSFKEDVQSRSFWDWLSAHTSFGLPLHHYEGKITLTRNALLIEGVHKRTGRHFTVELHTEQIKDIAYGYDLTYNKRQDRSVGLTFKPIRLTYVSNYTGVEHVLYLVVGFSRFGRTTSDREWFSRIRSWQRGGLSADATSDTASTADSMEIEDSPETAALVTSVH